MFTPGDFVQPRMGGPKLKVIEVNEDQIIAVRVGNEQDEKLTLKAADAPPIAKRAILACADLSKCSWRNVPGVLVNRNRKRSAIR